MKKEHEECAKLGLVKEVVKKKAEKSVDLKADTLKFSENMQLPEEERGRMFEFTGWLQRDR
jgi:hypothetical protein